VGPQLLDGPTDGSGVNDLAVTHSSLREGYLAELGQGDLTLAEVQLSSSHPRCPDVETDGGSSCHDANPSPMRPMVALVARTAMSAV
jgi:hypothetical protein